MEDGVKTCGGPWPRTGCACGRWLLDVCRPPEWARYGPRRRSQWMTQQHGRGRRWRRFLMMFVLLSGFIVLPLSGAQANPICPGDPAPLPLSATDGSEGVLVPPESQSSLDGSPDGLPPDASVYGQYGTAGLQWHMITESCVDGITNSAQATLTNSVWDLSKTINQSTITVYQAATSDGLLSSFTGLIESLVETFRE